MIRSLRLLALLVFLVPVGLFAQEATPDTVEPIAVISGPDEVSVGRTIVLDASSSQGLGENVQYRWYLDGVQQPISSAVEAVYTPEESGITIIRLVITTTVAGRTYEVETERAITVYERKMILIADAGVPPEKLETHRAAAADANIFLRVFQPEQAPIPLGTEEALFALMRTEAAAFNGAEAVVLWTDGLEGLQALMRLIENGAVQRETLATQSIILITDKSLGTLARTARGPFSVLHPERIVVTRKEAINPLLLSEDMPGFLGELEQRDIDLLIVDEASTALRPWNLFSSLVNYMLAHGVASKTVILLLMLPIIATILAFFKQVVGISTFGLYTPSIVALSLLALGWKLGLIFLVSIVVTGYAARAFMRRWRLLYIPKVAVILTIVSMTVLLLLAIGAYYEVTITGDTIFVLLIMSTLAESFLNAKREEGWRNAFIGIGETIGAALLCAFIADWAYLQSLILAYPELILLTLPVNIGLGRWTGLRLMEYFRFQEVFKHLQEE